MLQEALVSHHPLSVHLHNVTAVHHMDAGSPIDARICLEVGATNMFDVEDPEDWDTTRLYRWASDCLVIIVRVVVSIYFRYVFFKV